MRIQPQLHLGVDRSWVLQLQPPLTYVSAPAQLLSRLRAQGSFGNTEGQMSMGPGPPASLFKGYSPGDQSQKGCMGVPGLSFSRKGRAVVSVSRGKVRQK